MGVSRENDSTETLMFCIVLYAKIEHGTHYQSSPKPGLFANKSKGAMGWATHASHDVAAAEMIRYGIFARLRTAVISGLLTPTPYRCRYDIPLLVINHNRDP